MFTVAMFHFNMKPDSDQRCCRGLLSVDCISLFDSGKDTTLDIDNTGWEVREASVCSCCDEWWCILSGSLLEQQHSWSRGGLGHLKLMWKLSRFTFFTLNVATVEGFVAHTEIKSITICHSDKKPISLLQQRPGNQALTAGFLHSNSTRVWCQFTEKNCQ